MFPEPEKMRGGGALSYVYGAQGSVQLMLFLINTLKKCDYLIVLDFETLLNIILLIYIYI